MLDAGAVERTITQIKVMDAGNVERTLAFVRVMDAGGAVREVFTAGGGGGGSGANVSITPAYKQLSGSKPPQRSAIFTASGGGASVSGYDWGLVAGNGFVSGATDQQSATLTVGDGSSMFYCDMTIGGVKQRATCTFDFEFSGGGGGTLPEA